MYLSLDGFIRFPICLFMQPCGVISDNPNPNSVLSLYFLLVLLFYLFNFLAIFLIKKNKPKQTFFASQKHGVRIGAGHHHSWRLKPPHTCESNGTCFPRCSEHIPILAETPRLSLLQTTGCGCVESWLFISSTNSRFLDIAKVLQQQARI